MDSIIENINDIFMKKLRDLEVGHVLKDSDLCDIWDLIHAYELLDGNIISVKEQNKLIEYYGSN